MILRPRYEGLLAETVTYTGDGVDYEFHRYEGAGHGFFATDRPSYRPVQAKEAWEEVFKFYDKNLRD